MWGATLFKLAARLRPLISIHAPRVGSDVPLCSHQLLCLISIHAPRVGSDRQDDRQQMVDCYFNPRSPCGERPHDPSRRPAPQNFNPRSPCGERQVAYIANPNLSSFQSTLPVWGATVPALETLVRNIISIHAPRVGSDVEKARRKGARVYFNPRSPCGERPCPLCSASDPPKFQSTLPV